MHWFLYILLIIFGGLLVLFIYWLAGTMSRSRALKRLALHGRLIEWAAAVERTRSNQGFLVLKKNGAEEVWWVEGAPISDAFQLHMAVKNVALLVRPLPRKIDWSVFEKEGLSGSIMELSGHFSMDYKD